MAITLTLDGVNYARVHDPSDGIYVMSGWAEVLIPFESEEQKRMALRMIEIKEELSKTDYIVLKYMEGSIGDDEFQPVKRSRQSLRDEYNQLEATYTPPSYTENDLETAKKLFLDRDYETRKKYAGPNAVQLDPSVFL